MKTLSPTRRELLKLFGVTGGGLILGIPLGTAAETQSNTTPTNFHPNVFLQITANNEIHFYLSRSEMGQGTYTGLTTLVAEELHIQPQKIQIHHAGAHESHRNPAFNLQVTGGSTSTKVHYLPLRQMAANVREAIKQAAAQQLNAPIQELKLDNGNVIWKEEKHAYGDFATLAATRPLPENTPIKKPSEFTLIGTDFPRLDALAKSTGTAEFGIDVELPNLHRAALKRCPVHGGKVKQYDANTISSLPGVVKVVEIFNGVAVVAKTYWQARQAVDQLKIEWELPELAKYSSDRIYQEFKTALQNKKGGKAHKEGDGKKALDNASQVIQADYWAPYLAHATMEPLNCTVKIENNRCDVWVGSQSPEIAQGVAALHSGINRDDVYIHSTFLGGGFGRRSASDFVAEATSIAKASALPIQLLWSREDDTQHDLYRPASLAQFKAGVDENGKLQTWSVKRVGPNITPYTIDEAADTLMPGFIPDGMADWLSKRGYGLYNSWMIDESSLEGLFEDYDTPNKEVRHITVDPGLPLGYWRSVGHSFSGFFKESFIDEIAIATQQDPVSFRLEHSKNNKRLHEAIRTVAEKSNWGQTPANHFHGIAAHKSFGSYVAQVAEVSVEKETITVHKVTCVIDCGVIINPDIVKSQMESGIIFGITAALKGEITLQAGAVQQSNFHNYPILRMNETPDIDVHILNSERNPTGVGEPALPPIAAAISNAIFAATQRRLRSLPLRL